MTRFTSLSHHVLHRQRTDGKFPQVVFECLSVQLFREIGRHEVLHASIVLAVDEYHLCLFLTLAHPAVQCHAVNPACQVRLGNAPPDYPLEVHRQVKRHAVHVVGIGDDHVPSLLFLFHTTAKLAKTWQKTQINKCFFGKTC